MSLNVYYNPEAFGLTVVGELEFSSGSWEFDTTVVWKTGDGRLFYAQDSGCSCPVPFEDVRGLPDLVPITNLQKFEQHLRARHKELAGYRTEYVTRADIRDLMGKIREARR